MASRCVRFLTAAFVAACALSGPGAAIAAIPDGPVPVPGEFRVVPAQNGEHRPKSRLLAKPRPSVIVSSEGVSQVVREGLMRAALFGALGVAGLIFIGWRSYGRRQGRAAR